MNLTAWATMTPSSKSCTGTLVRMVGMSRLIWHSCGTIRRLIGFPFSIGAKFDGRPMTTDLVVNIELHDVDGRRVGIGGVGT